MEPIPNTVDTATAMMCKALGHPARLAILRQLLQEDRCICGRIVEVLPLAQSTVSQHLKVLKDAGLIRGDVEGPKTCYCADKTRLAALASALKTLISVSETDR
jgi:ArsR family transcriptional regulator